MKVNETRGAGDGLAIDVAYHYTCWRDNVDHIFRNKIAILRKMILQQSLQRPRF